MTEKVTILVVDDNPTNLKVLMDYLTQANFRVLVATRGMMALQQARRLPPDLILLDAMMPDLDGFEACRRLKEAEETRNVPVIFMTALTDIHDKVKAFEAGAVDYITKPFQQEELLARINTHLTLRRQQQELQQLNLRLAELNAAKNQFFSIIGHDLKSAIAPLLTYIELLIEAVQQDDLADIKQIVPSLQASGRNTFRLMDNLLNWANLQSEGVEVQPQVVDLSLLVDETLQVTGAAAQQKNIKLSHTLAPGTWAYADPNMISTILRNLVGNALKFTHPGGEVNVSALTTSQQVEVAVTDTGIGINPKYLPRLFRLDQSYKRAGTHNEPGTGLGLLLCKELVEKNGGQIWAESQEGQGTTVSFTLPATSAPSSGRIVQ